MWDPPASYEKKSYLNNGCLVYIFSIEVNYEKGLEKM